MKKTIFILLSAAAIFGSCDTAGHLHHSGVYTIKERNGAITEFFEVKGKYNIISDTLKKNDKIVINVVRAQPNQRNGKMKSDIARSNHTGKDKKSY